MRGSSMFPPEGNTMAALAHSFPYGRITLLFPHKFRVNDFDSVTFHRA